ncbi:uncharacterized protein LOC112638324 [Camponotus floridanus]|uniref:uncharacterized protein LOC112638324 n=1 Tax=Camponotus floridanus TaxID=104421 RepID=UPI000DC680FD|nr:uncharacterized protein LOC112638324 [Camponotus floridanus]
MSQYNLDDSEDHNSNHIFQNSENHIDKLIEIDNLNAMELLTPSDVLESIQMYDSTVEIVGYVDNIESPRCVGSQQQYKFFKFYLNNGKGKRVQIVAWNDDIDFVEHHIKVNTIIHLDGTQARPPKIPQFNNGNMPYELLIKSNTIISNLGKFEPMEIVDTTPETIELSDVLMLQKIALVINCNDAPRNASFPGKHQPEAAARRPPVGQRQRAVCPLFET